MKLSKLVSVEEVSEMVGTSVQTIRRWRQSGQFPEGIRFGRRTLRWHEETIQQWLEAKKLEAANLTTEKGKEHAKS